MFLFIRDIIVTIIDFVHKPFRKLIPAQTFRYLACGGGNTLLSMGLFALIYNYVLHGKDVHLPFDFILTSRVAALYLTFCFVFPIGFMLSSYVVFPESQIHTRVQFFRYSLATATFIFMAYVLTKFFAYELPKVRAEVSNVFVNMLTAVLSYLSQRFFTFKITKEATPGNEIPQEDIVKDAVR